MIYLKNLDKKDLEIFLMYLQDKVEFCYKEETKLAIERFLNENL